MPTINLNVKVTSGKRTPVQVVCYYTSHGEKHLELQNSNKKISNEKIATWITEELTAAIERYKSKL